MYSEQLEQLIKSVIADGVITEKERAVLHKKAASEGVDEDEIDVYVDGLVAQMKPQKEENIHIDLQHVYKYFVDIDYHGTTGTIYSGQKIYKVNNLNLNVEMYMNFYQKVVNTDTTIGISIVYTSKQPVNDYGTKLVLQTDTNRFDLPCKSEHQLEAHSDIKCLNKNQGFVISAFVIDKDILKRLSDAKLMKLSIVGFEIGHKDVEIENIPINDFATYAQVFYRSIIDNNAYQDAVIKQDNLVSDDNQDKTETDADSETLKVLTIPKKVMNKVALGHKYFEQFAIKNSDLQFIEFDEKHSLSSFNSYIKVFSILKDEKQQFFLKVVYNYYEEKKNRKGEVEQEKKVMNLNAGSIKIVCDGYTEVNLSPLAKSKAIFDKDSEMNFYPISEQDLRTILEAENVSINLYGKKLKAEDIKHVGFSSKLPFVWKQALATLMGEEIPEKKTLFGKIKGLFK